MSDQEDWLKDAIYEAKSHAAELLAKYPPPADARHRCAIAVAGRAAIVDELHAAGASNTRITSILRQEFALVIATPTVQRHVVRTCSCGRP